MKIERIGDHIRVIECVHCRGSGICQHAGLVITELGGNPGGILTCPKCGSGVFKPADRGLFGGLTMPDHKYMTRPTCAICGGKGYTDILTFQK